MIHDLVLCTSDPRVPQLGNLLAFMLAPETTLAYRPQGGSLGTNGVESR